MTAPPLLRFAGVRGGYDGSVVVRGVDGEVGRGEALCVLGRNGVGKSTLLKLLLGYLRGSGEVVFDDRPIEALDPAERSRRGIAYAPQERVVFDDLSVVDNLTLMRADRRLDGFAPYFERFPRLRQRLTQLAGTLSGGERKLLSFVRALAEDKPLTLLDEPSEGVQRENIEHMAALIAARRREGGAFILVEQNLDLVSAVADRITVLDQGRTVLAGTAAEIPRSAILRHLGV